MTNKDMIAEVNKLMSFPMTYVGLKEKGQAWIDSVGKEIQKEKADDFLAEVKACIQPIDSVIEFFSSDMAKNIFGEEGAKEKLEGSIKAKEAGAIYCPCPACSSCKVIIDNSEALYA